ncbi:MAG: poly-beta-1,6-N-acetyl-D-glucosamine biosynthesis protein PgaD [Azonexus sp.]|jgi:poly-beta-1,6-N-acetyl-D-glucosamine biosynthesis protein PgaD
MDKSRPGHQTRLPLIIERPDLTHPVRRVMALLATTLAWLLWLVMWIPFIAALGRHFGFDLPEIFFPSQISLDSFFALLHVTPYVLAFAAAVLIASYLREKLKARFGKPDERWRPVGIARLASSTALDPELLAAWQAAQILYVKHGPLGRVTGASTTLPSRPS